MEIHLLEKIQSVTAVMICGKRADSLYHTEAEPNVPLLGYG
jgi:hypothetical protein